MKVNFDYYNKVKSPTFYLYTPSRRLQGSFGVKDDNFNLRFNDLSEVTFTVYKYDTNSDGEQVLNEMFDEIKTRKLVCVDGIGWFQITNIDESLDGKSKSVTINSHQVMLREKGIYIEARVHKFYNPDDPTDANYDASSRSAIPSICGQLYQQLGISTVLMVNDADQPEEDLGEWTITYIDPSLKYTEGENNNIVRGFPQEITSNGYDFIINNVEEAFGVIFDFDILTHSIKIKSVNNATKRTNIYLSLDNIANEINVTESADDLVTVLTCTGGDLDLKYANPAGQQYITNFEYYYAEYNEDGSLKSEPWMSDELTRVLKNREKRLEDELNSTEANSYTKTIEKLSDKWAEHTELSSKKEYYSVKLTDLTQAQGNYTLAVKNANDMPSVDEDGDATTKNKALFAAHGAVSCTEKVENDEKSLEPTSEFFNSAFNKDTLYTKTLYSKPPVVIKNNNEYILSFTDASYDGGNKSGVISSLVNGSNLIEGDTTSKETYCYYIDNTTNKSYVKFIGGVRLKKDEDGNLVKEDGEYVTEYYVSGFERYSLPEEISIWHDRYTLKLKDLQEIITLKASEIDVLENRLESIAEKFDFKKLADYDEDGNKLSTSNTTQNTKLYNELSNYWVEGEYKDDNLSIDDKTTMADRIKLAKELYDNGSIELEKVSQPRFSISSTALNFLALPEFKEFAHELELGCIITIEKDRSTHYYPALTSISFSLSDFSNFSLEFSNAFKMSDWGYTVGDLLKEASNTSKTVSANWSKMMDFSNNSDEIFNLIQNPLDLTLRAAQSNLYNQDFVVLNDGILGRQKKEDGSFEPEQIRLMNNLILFTDDNWTTARAAFGKIRLDDNTTSYGLIADTLVGKLVLGEALKATNNEGTVSITGDGIQIINESTGNTVFSVDKNGNVVLEPTEQIKKHIEETKKEINNTINEESKKVSDLTERVTTTETNIGGIQTSVNGLQGNYTTINNSLTEYIDDNDRRVGEAETQISTNASNIEANSQKIAAKVSSSKYNDKMDEIDSSIGALEVTSNNALLGVISIYDQSIDYEKLFDLINTDKNNTENVVEVPDGLINISSSTDLETYINDKTSTADEKYKYFNTDEGKYVLKKTGELVDEKYSEIKNNFESKVGDYLNEKGYIDGNDLKYFNTNTLATTYANKNSVGMYIYSETHDEQGNLTDNSIEGALFLKKVTNDDGTIATELIGDANYIKFGGDSSLVEIESNNFILDKNGNIMAHGGEIGGIAISADSLTTGNFILQTIDKETTLKFGIYDDNNNITNTLIDKNGIITSKFIAGGLTVSDRGLTYNTESNKVGTQIYMDEIENDSTETVYVYPKAKWVPELYYVQGGMSGSYRTRYRLCVYAESSAPWPEYFSRYVTCYIGGSYTEPKLVELLVGATKSSLAKTDYTVTDANSSLPSSISFCLSTGALRENEYSTTVTSNPAIGITGNLLPKADGSYNLGSTSKKWNNIYSQSVTTSTANVNTVNSENINLNGAPLVSSSDKNKKQSITEIDKRFDKFYDLIEPSAYRFKNNNSNRIHLGFIAQGIEKALLDSGLTTQDFGGVCYWNNSDGVKEYGLRYSEFIPLNTHEIQKLKKRVAAQDERIFQLEQQLQGIKGANNEII